MERSQYYRLLSDNSIEPCDLLEWVKQLDQRGLGIINQDTVQGYLISTVFLGMDHNWESAGPPLLFETMCFDSDGKEINMIRYSTWEQAEWGHREIVRRMIQRLDPQWLIDRGYPLLPDDEVNDDVVT